MPAYELHFHEEALAEWHSLDAGIRSRLKKKLERRLSHPDVESARLSGELAGLFVIRMHGDGIRLIYEIDQSQQKIIVASVGRRENLSAYKGAVQRKQN
jgi:mRNA-degrading endonuclease RelE of RelBE toxin-antitoxin system